MAKKRVTKTVIKGVTRAQMEAAFADLAMASAKIQSIEAAADAEITKIRERATTDAGKWQEQHDAAFETLQVFAAENREELLSKKKSLETMHGILGYRTGNIALKARRGFTWGAVLELLKEFDRNYIRTSEEVNKDKFIADRETPETKSLMLKCGVQIEQSEKFFVELKKEENAECLAK